MKLPVIIPEIRSQAWDCRSCTNCCRELVVHLTIEDRQRIDKQQWSDKLDIAPYVKHATGTVLNHVPGGGCVFLRDDGKCRIHAEFGMDAKPLACRIYPFTLEREGESLRAGIRFDCPTVTRNEGRPLPSHRRELEHNAGAIATEMPSEFRADSDDVAFSLDLTIDRASLQRIIARLDRWISDARRSIHDRLRGLHSVISTLNHAKLERFDSKRLVELVDMLMEDLPTSLAESVDAPAPPTAAQTKLLCQSAFAHSGYVRFEESRLGFWASLRFRMGQLKAARRMLQGTGPIPPLSCDTLSTSFEALEAVGPIAPEYADQAADLVTRYLQSRITNHDGFGRAYYGWTVLAGLNAALLSVAVAGWFARRSAGAAGRPLLNLEDARRGFAVVGRAAGRAPELGAKSAKLRLTYLCQEDGLIRLLLRYPIVAPAAIDRPQNEAWDK